MTETGRAALFWGPGKPMEITELPVPDPEPGAVVVRITSTNICGSDLVRRPGRRPGRGHVLFVDDIGRAANGTADCAAVRARISYHLARTPA